MSKQKQNGKVYTYEEKICFADVHHAKYEQNRLNCGRRPKWIDGHKFIEWADQKML